MAKHAFNLPNMLTYARILAVPVIVLCFYLELRPRPTDTARWVAFGLFAAASVTDYFDGYLARTQGTVSKLGVFLDPIADKIMVAAVILMLVGTRFEDRAIITGIHLIAALVILLREIAVSGLREFLGGIQVSVPVSKLAKWKTTLQLVALGALILAGALPHEDFIKVTGLAALWGAAVLTVVTGWDYLRVGLKHMD
jgi:CDP-diacylglycerol--glycerol-3-phosphate 3-phosphatidyltransferase